MYHFIFMALLDMHDGDRRHGDALRPAAPDFCGGIGFFLRLVGMMSLTLLSVVRAHPATGSLSSMGLPLM
jgi:hypothetical protein